MIRPNSVVLDDQAIVNLVKEYLLLKAECNKRVLDQGSTHSGARLREFWTNAEERKVRSIEKILDLYATAHNISRDTLDQLKIQVYNTIPRN